MKLVGLRLTPEQREALLKRNTREFKNYNHEEEEKRRREACPLYWAMFFPNLPLHHHARGDAVGESQSRTAPTRRGRVSDLLPKPREVSVEGFLQTLLQNWVSIAIRRHGSLLERDPLIMRVFQSIPRANTQLRLAALFLFMWAEPVIVDYLAAMYTAGSLELHAFHRVVHAMKLAVDEMLGSLPTIYNVVQKKKRLIEYDLIEAFTGGGGRGK